MQRPDDNERDLLQALARRRPQRVWVKANPKKGQTSHGPHSHSMIAYEVVDGRQVSVVLQSFRLLLSKVDCTDRKAHV